MVDDPRSRLKKELLSIIGKQCKHSTVCVPSHGLYSTLVLAQQILPQSEPCFELLVLLKSFLLSLMVLILSLTKQVVFLFAVAFLHYPPLVLAPVLSVSPMITVNFSILFDIVVMVVSVVIAVINHHHALISVWQSISRTTH